MQGRARVHTLSIEMREGTESGICMDVWMLWWVVEVILPGLVYEMLRYPNSTATRVTFWEHDIMVSGPLKPPMALKSHMVKAP